MLHWSWPWMSEPDKRRTLGCSPTWMTLHSWRDSSHSGTDKPQSELWTPWMAQPQGCQVNVPKDLFSCTIFSTYRRLYRRLCYRRLQYCLSACINAFKISLAWNAVQQQGPGLLWNFMKLWAQSHPLPHLCSEHNLWAISTELIDSCLGCMLSRQYFGYKELNKPDLKIIFLC